MTVILQENIEEQLMINVTSLLTFPNLKGFNVQLFM